MFKGSCCLEIQCNKILKYNYLFQRALLRDFKKNEGAISKRFHLMEPDARGMVFDRMKDSYMPALLEVMYFSLQVQEVFDHLVKGGNNLKLVSDVLLQWQNRGSKVVSTNVKVERNSTPDINEERVLDDDDDDIVILEHIKNSTHTLQEMDKINIKPEIIQHSEDSQEGITPDASFSFVGVGAIRPVKVEVTRNEESDPSSSTSASKVVCEVPSKNAATQSTSEPKTLHDNIEEAATEEDSKLPYVPRQNVATQCISDPHKSQMLPEETIVEDNSSTATHSASNNELPDPMFEIDEVDNGNEESDLSAQDATVISQSAKVNDVNETAKDNTSSASKEPPTTKSAKENDDDDDDDIEIIKHIKNTTHSFKDLEIGSIKIERSDSSQEFITSDLRVPFVDGRPVRLMKVEEKDNEESDTSRSAPAPDVVPEVPSESLHDVPSIHAATQCASEPEASDVITKEAALKEKTPFSAVPSINVATQTTSESQESSHSEVNRPCKAAPKNIKTISIASQESDIIQSAETIEADQLFESDQVRNEYDSSDLSDQDDEVDTTPEKPVINITQMKGWAKWKISKLNRICRYCQNLYASNINRDDHLLQRHEGAGGRTGDLEAILHPSTLPSGKEDIGINGQVIVDLYSNGDLLKHKRIPTDKKWREGAAMLVEGGNIEAPHKRNDIVNGKRVHETFVDFYNFSTTGIPTSSTPFVWILKEGKVFMNHALTTHRTPRFKGTIEVIKKRRHELSFIAGRKIDKKVNGLTRYIYIFDDVPESMEYLKKHCLVLYMVKEKAKKSKQKQNAKQNEDGKHKQKSKQKDNAKENKNSKKEVTKQKEKSKEEGKEKNISKEKGNAKDNMKHKRSAKHFLQNELDHDLENVKKRRRKEEISIMTWNNYM